MVRLLPNPLDLEPPEYSVALIVRRGDVTTWSLEYVDEGGGAAAVGPAESDVSFEDWVAENSTIYAGKEAKSPSSPTGGPWPGDADLQLVRFAPEVNRLVPFDAVTMLRQRATPDVGDAFATAADQSAVAEVRFEGERWYVLARRLAGEAPQYIAVKAADGGATLDDFLDLARERYAEGGGGLL